MNLTPNPEEFNGITISRDSGELRVSSRQIAEHFGKVHSKVLRAIRNLECSEEFNAANFGRVEYLDAKGEAREEYAMTRDGFTFLAMGFTGKEAAVWKEKYIAAFNAMEREIRHRPTALTGEPLLATALIEAHGVLQRQAKQIEVMQPKAEAYERIEGCEGSLVPRLAAKTLGCPERKFTKFLEVNGWAFRQGGKGPLQAYSQRLKSGHLDHDLKYFTDPKTGDEKVRAQLLVTPKGMALLAKQIPAAAEVAS